MARMRVFIVLALAIAAGGTFAFGTYQYMQNVPARTVEVPTSQVVVAATDLQLGAELKPTDLKAIQWPSGAVPEGSFAKPEDLVGRGLILPVVQNEPFLPSKLAPKEAGAGLPPVIQPGYRALSVRVNDVVGVAGYVLPGTRVDVVATVNPTQQPQDITSKVILTNVLVLAAGTKIERDVENNKPVQVNVVTLLVNPDEAERLTLASTEGKIQLALRNPMDQTAPHTSGVRPAGLMGSGVSAPVRRVAANTAAPRQPEIVKPAPLPTVEIIRGDKRAQEAVAQE
jgi:pilus assembly protein CpaB